MCSNNHSTAWNRLCDRYPAGTWPIDTISNLRTSWKSWRSNPQRHRLRSDEFRAIESRFQARAFVLGIVLHDDGTSELVENSRATKKD